MTPDKSRPPCSPAEPVRRSDAMLHLRRDRLGLGVRCGYHPSWPQAIQLYLDAGQALAVAGLIPEALMLRQSLKLLLNTANDEALPRPWRLACLALTRQAVIQLQEQADWPEGAGDMALLQARLQADLTLLCMPACVRAHGSLPTGADDGH